MKRIVILMMLIAFGICVTGCQQKVKNEKHKVTHTKTIESQEIVVE